MSASALRQKYNRRLAKMDKYTSLVSWMIFGGYVAQIIGAVALGGWLLSLAYSWATPFGIAAIMLFIGTRLRGLNNIIHECSHATFSRDRALNTLIGKLCAVLLFNSFSDYRDEHLTHHAHLGDYDHDQDLQGIQDLKIHDALTVRVVLRHLVTPLLGRHLPYYLNLNMSARDGAIFVVLKALLLFVVCALIFAAPITIVLFVVLPFALVYSALNYWADCLDHAGIVASPDDLDASRNILAPVIIRRLFFPRNDCFHLVHHLFPHVPARHLETSHQLLAQDEIYASRPNAVPARDRASGWTGDSTIPAE